MRKVPRLMDIPYSSSPPIEFTYQQTAALVGGAYTWTATPTALVPNRPLVVNALYYFRNITLAADTEELDFTANITTTPTFQMYLKSRAKSILFREPIYMLKFMQNFEYHFTWVTQQVDDQLFAAFSGAINQGPAFIGKASITLKAIISAQEVVDETFVKMFRDGYPHE